MSVYRVIDKLEASVKQGTVLPLGYRVVSEERLLELIEKLRSSLPEEVGRARTIAKNGDRLVRDAQEKAQAIVSEASQAQTQLIDDHEIVRRARATAEIVLREAEQKAQRVREGADAYAASVLSDLDVAALDGAGLGQEGHRSADRRQDRRRRRARPPSLADAAAQVQAGRLRRPAPHRHGGARIGLERADCAASEAACGVPALSRAFVAFDVASQVQSVAIAWQVYSVAAQRVRPGAGRAWCCSRRRCCSRR